MLQTYCNTQVTTKITVSPIKTHIGRYTLDIFLKRAHEIHKNLYDYSLITSRHIDNSQSKVPIRCNICQHIWECSITNHIIKKRGCTKCNKRLRWNYERFIAEARNIQGNKYIYHLSSTDHITSNTKISMTCNICYYEWSSTPDNHIGKESKCPNCSKVAPWNYDRLTSTSMKIHGDKYDYSLVPLDIKGAFSYITLICKDCEYKWDVTIDNHINEPLRLKQSIYQLHSYMTMSYYLS